MRKHLHWRAVSFFFNEKMDTTANGYSKAGWQRMFGASMAAKKGAEAVITRSLSPVSDNFQEREHSDMKKV